MKAKLALTVGLLALMASPGMAQLNRSAVLGAGVDTNTCTPAQHAGPSARAHNQTNARGEIIVLDRVGTRVVTITKSLSLICSRGLRRNHRPFEWDGGERQPSHRGRVVPSRFVG